MSGHGWAGPLACVPVRPEPARDRGQDGESPGRVALGDGDLRVRKSSVTDKINLDRYTRALALAGVRNSVRNQCPETCVTGSGFRCMIGIHEPSCAPSHRPACRLRPDLRCLSEPGRADRRADRGGLRKDLRRHRVGETGRAAGADTVPGVSAGRGHAGGVAAGPAGPVPSASGGDRQRAGRARGGVRFPA